MNEKTLTRMDNATRYGSEDDEIHAVIKEFTITFVFPNTTVINLSLDQNAIESTKIPYRKNTLSL